MFNRLLQRMLASEQARSVVRGVLFLYLGLILCPIRYWALSEGADMTWVFGLNYAAAHDLVMGRDFVWTAGPLGYLAGPMDIGNNLAEGLAFQTGLWVLLLAILWDLFFRGGFALRNLTFFSVFLGLSGPLYHHFHNPLAAGDLLFVGALILLVHFRLRGGISRYIVGLVMLGLVPLIKFVGVLTGVGVMVGVIVDRFVRNRLMAWRETVLAGVLPALVAGTGYWLTLGSFHTLALYFKGNLELSRGYNLAMAQAGPRLELIAGFEAVVLLALALAILAARDHRIATFFGLLLVVPLFVYLKHSFVRQDSHILYIFSFVAVSLGLIALATVFDGQRATWTLTVVTLVLAILCQDYVGAKDLNTAVSGTTGIKVPSRVWRAVRFRHLQQWLDQKAQQHFSSDELRVEPEIKAIIQHEQVASLSVSYSGLVMGGLHLVLYPVIQRYAAFTYYLDGLNADWIRDQGSRFLIFNDESMTIDGRHPWAETPAMWAEVYRWYDTRILGRHTLLLERRSNPRFSRFEPVGHSRVRFGNKLLIPASPQPVFWTMQCSLTRAGRLRALLFRVVDVTMTLDGNGEQGGVFRVLPEVLGAPSLGNYLPSDLSQFAEVFNSAGRYNFSVKTLSFGGPGSSAYAPFCEVEFLQPVH